VYTVVCIIGNPICRIKWFFSAGKW